MPTQSLTSKVYKTKRRAVDVYALLISLVLIQIYAAFTLDQLAFLKQQKQKYDDIDSLKSRSHEAPATAQHSKYLKPDNRQHVGDLFHFIHTSSPNSFGKKQMKAIESVFYHHPRAQVKLWGTEMKEVPILLQPFLDKGYNITLIMVDLKKEIESLLEVKPENYQRNNTDDDITTRHGENLNGKIIQQFLSRWKHHVTTKFWVNNISNVLRMIILYREGGVYLDTDVFLIKPMRKELENSLGHEMGADKLNNAVLIFEQGNPFIHDCIEDTLTYFNGNAWGKQGPAMVTRVFKKGNYSSDIVKVQPQMTFYPYHYTRAKMCFSNATSKATKKIPTIADMVKYTYIVHTNNKVTKDAVVEPGSTCGCLEQAFCVVSDNCYPKRCTLFDPPVYRDTW